MYDFDGTLSPGNMQEYGFLDKLGESSTEFWRKSNEEARKFEMDPISAYMHLMIKETESRALNISKENLIKLGLNSRTRANGVLTVSCPRTS